MKCLRLFTLLVGVATTASGAWAQSGLYGSPGMINLPPAQAGYAAPPATPRYTAPPAYAAPVRGAPAYAVPVRTAPAYAAPTQTPRQYAPWTQTAALGQVPQSPPAPAKSAPLAPAPQPSSPTPTLAYPPPMQGQPAPMQPAPMQPAPMQPGSMPPPMANPSYSGSPNVVNTMVTESPACAPAYPAACSPGYASGYSSGACGPAYGGSGTWGEYGSGVEMGYEQGAFGEAACGPAYGGAAACDFGWYVSLSGLVMGRNNHGNRVWVSFENGNNPNQLMHSNTDLGWGGGGEVRLGHLFSCGTWALEATYWGVSSLTGDKSVTHPSGVSTPLNFFDVVYAHPSIPGSPVDLFDGAREHRLSRTNEFQNVELNLIHHQGQSDPCNSCNPCNPLAFNWLVGVRFFKFDEDLAFSSLRAGGSGWANPSSVGYLKNEIENNLVGVQFGCNLNYRQGDWRMFFSPRVGLFNNSIQHRASAFRGDGASFATAPLGYPNYPVESETDVVSFLTQIDVGLEWQFAQQWSAHLGYRLVVASGMGLADHQIPPFVVDTPEVAAIDTNGDLVLHGGFAGLTFRF